MKGMRIAISYVRWSTPQQKLGDSKRRQVDRTLQFCNENNLYLDQQLVGSGLSAYSGKHRREGTDLARFLQELKDGKVPKGAVLIIESLDRLTRQKIAEALELFLSIIRAGVEIVTLIDKQWYTAETLGEIQNLLVSIISLWRAYEDSRHKGERVGHAWETKRGNAINLNVPMTSICPGWLKLAANGKNYDPIPERAKKVKLIFWLTLRGWGAGKIARLFNRHSVPTWGVGKKAAKGWHVSYIKKILKNRSVMGEFLPHTTKAAAATDTKDEAAASVRRAVGKVLSTYYPRIISEATFQKVQLRRPAPKGYIGRRVSNLFQGLIKDGDFPKYSMCYRDHGHGWQYVQVSLKELAHDLDLALEEDLRWDLWFESG
jgi:DNA invertase Pin-like site-specific DNA recombinase